MVQTGLKTDMQTDASAAHLPRPRLKRSGFLREILDLIVLVGAIYALVNLATVRFVVDGPSMEPSFYNSQFLIVSRVSYLVSDPQRGDVVVFHYPGNTQEDYIKRVIGLPGDTVELRDAEVYINGERLEEPYINEACRPERCRDNAWELGPDEFFVMGDNRNRSQDSRDFGPVLREYVVGQVFVRYWPPADWGLVGGISYSGSP